MNGFQVHTVESAPEASKPILEKMQKTTGFIPNLYGVLAESRVALEAYVTLGAAFDRSTSFNARERQVVLLTVVSEHESGYCMAFHSTIAGMQRVPDEVVHALRSGEPIPHARLEALSAFVRNVIRERGWVSEGDVQAFLDAGFTRAQVFEVVLGVAMKVLSNYANQIAKTPVDAAFQANTWAPPSKTGQEQPQ